MELRHLRYFVAVAEELHFGRAAERLGIKQPPLSAQIRQLEDELGTPLFRRTPRGVVLTEAGEALLEDARPILAMADQAKLDVAKRARGETGRLRIGFGGGTPFEPVTARTAKTYRDKYPEVVVHPTLRYTAQLVVDVQDGVCDVAFVWLPLPRHEGLSLHPMAEERVIAVLPANHRLAGRDGIALSELAGDSLLLVARAAAPDFYDSIIDGCHKAGLTPTIGPQGPSIASLIGMVAVGLGVALAPECLSQIRPAGVVYMPLEGEPLMARIGIIHRRDDTSAAVHEFVAVARSCRESARRVSVTTPIRT